MAPQIITQVSELTRWRKSVGSSQVGFVATMGALHEGHASLLRAVRPRCDQSVLSIFVNPTQFSPSEDLDKYPRTFDQDLRLAARENVDVIFAPNAKEMYPNGYSTYIDETLISKPLCGVHRHGHFRGVATVVLKLFNLVQPHLSLWGLKDAQQFFVIRKMVEDLNLNTVVEGCPTVREPDGLAMSSRNVYLLPDQREIAPMIYRTLRSIETKLLEGADLQTTLEIGRCNLAADGFDVQYLDLLRIRDFALKTDSLERGEIREPLLLACAAYLGKTRLIDNLIIGKLAN